MSSRKRIRGEGAFGPIVGIAVGVLVGLAPFKIIPLHYAGNKVRAEARRVWKEVSTGWAPEH